MLNDLRRTLHLVPAALVACLFSAPAWGTSETVIYSFGLAADGPVQPNGALISRLGLLYGTSAYGGDTKLCKSGCGTVFSVTPDGKVTVLLELAGPITGIPETGLISAFGKFYGTGYGLATRSRAYSGAVFSLTLSGRPALVYAFKGTGPATGAVEDGSNPGGSLTEADGLLFGTTSLGGLPGCQIPQVPALGCGTVYSLTTAGKENVLYRFKGGLTDGESPGAGLIYLDGTLYGTSFAGGSNCLCGTIFKISLAGHETILYAFRGGTDGRYPADNLIYLNGALYGTAQSGVESGGSVFSITPAGAFAVLHSFAGGSGDGFIPVGPVTDVNGTLYGTTLLGGAYDAGTIFSITPNGTETVLYSFGKDADDAAYPKGGLTLLGGALYGITTGGGAHGYGAVFKFLP